MKLLPQRIFALLTIALISFTAQAEIKLPHIIADNMMLQQKSKCPLWGWANPGEKVIIKSSWGAKSETITDENGKWLTTIDTPKYSKTTYYIDFIGENYLRVSNVIIGDVFDCRPLSQMPTRVS